jgi:hypothetical protein
MNRVIRCPDCFLEHEFQADGKARDGGFVCSECGHRARPDRSDFDCSCPHCLACPICPAEIVFQFHDYEFRLVYYSGSWCLSFS